DGMDRTARILARHWPDTIPGNPTIIAKNMPGAGSLRATEYLYTQAPKDGTVLGALIPVFVLQQAMGGGTAGSINYDAAKFGWIGSSNTSTQMVYVWHRRGLEQRSLSHHPQQCAGHPVQDHHGLPRRARDRPRHGARRGAGPCR